MDEDPLEVKVSHAIQVKAISFSLKAAASDLYYLSGILKKEMLAVFFKL